MNLDRFKGFGSPLTARGLASLYGPLPWHMAGRVLTVWFHAPAGEVERHVPAPLTVPAGALSRVRFYQLLHNVGLDDALSAEDPARVRFHEAVLAVPVAYKDSVGDYSVHLYSENIEYICWAREAIGWPVKGGDINISEPWPGTPLASGNRVTATLTRHGRRLMTATLTLTAPMPPAAYPTSPMPTYTVKVIPGAEERTIALRQVVEVRPSLPRLEGIWYADATLELEAGPSDELHFFTPLDIVRAEYTPLIELTMPYGRVVENL